MEKYNTPLENTYINNDDVIMTKQTDLKENDIINIADKVSKVQGFISRHNYQFRICLIGDSNVGKTSLLKRYYDKSFSQDYVSTIGCDFKVITLNADGKVIKLQIWDTAGQERFKAISINYFRSAHGFIFVFDISKRETFNNVENWVNTAFGINKNNLCNILIGNKRDLDSFNKRQVSQEEAIILAKSYNMAYLETSAKEDLNVETMFHYLTFQLSEKYLSGNVFIKDLDEEDYNSKANNLDLHMKKKNCIC